MKICISIIKEVTDEQEARDLNQKIVDALKDDIEASVSAAITQEIMKPQDRLVSK